MLDKLEAIKNRFDEVSELIVKPEIIADMKQYILLNKEYKDLLPIIDAYKIYKNIYELFIKYTRYIQNTRRRPGGSTPARHRAARRLVFCISLVYARLEHNTLILGCWQPLPRMLQGQHPNFRMLASTD